MANWLFYGITVNTKECFVSYCLRLFLVVDDFDYYPTRIPCFLLAADFAKRPNVLRITASVASTKRIEK